jgi:hypothetical protein
MSLVREERHFDAKRRNPSLRQQLEASLHRMTTIPIIQSTNILFVDGDGDGFGRLTNTLFANANANANAAML